MNISINMKFLAMSILLILITALGTSITYYVLTRQGKRQESQQRVRIAFEIILDDITNRVSAYSKRFDEFLKEDTNLRLAIHSYQKNTSWIGEKRFISRYLKKGADDLKKFGHIVSANRLVLYAEDTRLLIVHQQSDDQEITGGYVVSETGNNTYLPLDDSPESNEILFNQNTGIPEGAPLPSGISAQYEGDMPDTLIADLFRAEQTLGIRITAPIYRNEERMGVLVGEIWFNQNMVERYASLSKTDINLFAGNQLSIGTLDAQTQIEAEALEQSIPCNELLKTEIPLLTVTLQKLTYSQGRCLLQSMQDNAPGVITVSLSREIEQAEIRKILLTMLSVSGIAVGAAFGLSILISRKTLTAIQHLVSVIAAGAEGDLRKTAEVTSGDEIGMLALNLNRMLAYLQQMTAIATKIATGDLSQAVVPRSEHDALGNAFQAMATYLSEMAVVAAAIADGDLRQDIEPKNEHDVLGLAFSRMKTVRQTMTQMVHGATQLSQASEDLHQINLQMATDAEHTSQQASSVSSNSQKISEHVSKISTTIEEFAASIREISRNTENVLQVIASAVKIADSASKANAELVLRSREVGEIVNVITTITQQTNLLALNATIEAARAGEVGRGFAVVANEVKELARETAVSAENIIRKVEAMQVSSHETALAIDEMSQIIRRVHELSESISTSVHEQSAVTSQIVNNIADVSTGSEEITHTITEVAEVAERTLQQVIHVKTAAQQMAAFTEKIQQLISTFKI